MTFESLNRDRSGYRAEVDGLRAVAVVSVIAYHANHEWLPGGFAGVDVFFVISGYLITRILLGEMERGAFSMAGFWLRRIRRIAPALFVMLGVTLVVGAFILSPLLYDQLGRLTALNVVPVANIDLALLPAGYFAPLSASIPLIHTWSLSLEEQFYLLFPPVLWLAYRLLKGRVLALLILGIIVSVVLAWRLEFNRPSFAFYLLPTRAWELLAGAVVARAGTIAWPREWIRQAAALAGLAMIGGGIAVAHRLDAPFPAVVPAVFGTALFIAAADARTWPGRLLAMPPFVAIGLISYSLYLWHQPVFAVARANGMHPPQPLDFIPLTLLAAGLAVLSWRYVERPFLAPGRISNRHVLILFAVTGAVLVATGIVIGKSAGFPNRFPPVVRQAIASAEATRLGMAKCALATALSRECVVGDNGPVEVAVVGDSHAMALLPGFDEAARRRHIRVAVFWKSGCPPALDAFPKLNQYLVIDCNGGIRDAVMQASRMQSIKTVLFVGRWAHALDQSVFDNQEGGVEPPVRFSLDREYPQRLRTGFLAAVQAMQRAGKRVILIGPTPEVGWHVPTYMQTSSMIGPTRAPDTSLAVFYRRQATTIALLEQVSARTGAPILWPHKALCSERTGRCYTADGVRPWYIDDDHLSPLGAAKMVAAMERDIFR